MDALVDACTRTHAPHTHTHTSMYQYLFLFQDKNGDKNAPQYYVIRTVSVVFSVKTVMTYIAYHYVLRE